MKTTRTILLVVLFISFIVTGGYSQLLESFDSQIEYVAGGAPGKWDAFSCNARYVTHTGALSGGAFVLEKEGLGWGCGAQYTLTAPQDWTGKQVSFWVKIDTVEFTTVNFQVFDAVDGEQWEQKISSSLQKGEWVEIVATISPEYFVDNGNGATGDGSLDVTQIQKFNLIVFNNGEDFTRKIMFDEIVLQDVPSEQPLIESFENEVTFEAPSATPTPGVWNYFSADTVYVAEGMAHDGDHAVVIEKSGTGWGCGIQYGLPEVMDMTGKAVSFWVYVDSVEFSGLNFQVFDAADGEQWEQKIVSNPLKKGWQQVVAHLDPVYFQDNGNGSAGDGMLDVSQISKFNIIIFNRGEDFKRTFRVDDIRILNSPIRPLTEAHLIEDFDAGVMFEPPSGDPTPGYWNYFSADTAFVGDNGSWNGQSMIIEKSGIGWGCGVQYGLPQQRNWRGKQVSFWVHIDSVEFTVINFQVFDAVDGEQWEQKVSNNFYKNEWVEIVATISPEYFVNNGNGGTGDGMLDVTQITKFNLIILNSGEDFKRTISIDDIRLIDMPNDAQLVDSFEDEVTFEPPSDSPTPGYWNYFSADTVYKSSEMGHDGASSLVVEKSGTGWGCGVQYGLPEVQNWTDKAVSFWVYVDSVEFSSVNFQVFDATDNEQWEQKVSSSLLKQGWQNIVAHIDPVYFVNNGNGGTGDANLDVAHICKYNIIFLNNGEDFKRTFMVDNIRVIDSPMPTGIASSTEEIPTDFSLFQNYPNPFNPSTTITYSLERPNHVEISVFNIMGQRVKTLVNTWQSTGMHSVQWNGMDKSGAIVASGTYFYVLKCEGVTLKRKLLLLK